MHSNPEAKLGAFATGNRRNMDKPLKVSTIGLADTKSDGLHSYSYRYILHDLLKAKDLRQDYRFGFPFKIICYLLLIDILINSIFFF